MNSVLFMLILVTPWLMVLCWYDCKYRRLPNYLTLGMAVGALVWRLGYGRMPLFADGVAGGLAAGLFLLIPFLLGGAGGGDLKMLTAVGCLGGLHRIPLLLFNTSGIGFVLALPFSWWVVSGWLENFAFRVPLTPLVFILIFILMQILIIKKKLK